MFTTTFAQEATKSLVTCGVGEANTPCTMADLFSTLNNFSAYLLYAIFPFAFFFAIIYAFLPILKDPSNTENINHMKKSIGMIAIGTVFVVGSFFLVRFLLGAIGVNNSAVNSAFEENTDEIRGPQSFRFIETAYAQNVVQGGVLTNGLNAATEEDGMIKDPLKSSFVKNVLSGIINILYFFAVIGIAYGYVRGALLLVLSQQNPGNIAKGKQWVIWTTVVAVVLFAAPKLLDIIMDTVQSLK